MFTVNQSFHALTSTWFAMKRKETDRKTRLIEFWNGGSNPSLGDLFRFRNAIRNAGRCMASPLRLSHWFSYFAYDSKKPQLLQRIVTTGDDGSSLTPEVSTLGFR